jgi:hypothetical protein
MSEQGVKVRNHAPWRVLIWPGGTEIGLELRKALGWSKEVKLFSASADISNHAPFVFAEHFNLPRVYEPGALDALATLVKEQGITHIFPAHDDIVVALAEVADSFPAKVVTSPCATCRIARFKSSTLKHLSGVVPTPKIYAKAEDVGEFPVFVKPDRGQGSFNAARVDSAITLHGRLSEDPTRLILEYLPGPEFTVDCFTDRESGLQYSRGRQRRRIRAGIAMDSRFVEDPRFEEMARAISAKLVFHGAWFFQVKAAADGELKLLELAPRIGGTSGLSRAAGVNLPLLSLYEAERIPVQIAATKRNVEIDRALINRYRQSFDYSTLYVDFDDTLVIHDRVNPDLVKLIYQALNHGVRLVLLTRHDGDLDQSLKHHRLNGLFDEIVHLKNGETKATFITDSNGLLIDDSFSERHAVCSATGIAVMDPSMVETLLDDRL